MVKRESEIPLCGVCVQAIKHPICEKCHVREVAAWLRDRDVSKERQAMLLYLMDKKLVENDMSAGYCISCWNELPHMCSYCFFYSVARMMKRLGFSEDDMESFFFFFYYRHYEDDYVL